MTCLVLSIGSLRVVATVLNVTSAMSGIRTDWPATGPLPVRAAADFVT